MWIVLTENCVFNTDTTQSTQSMGYEDYRAIFLDIIDISIVETGKMSRHDMKVLRKLPLCL